MNLKVKVGISGLGAHAVQEHLKQLLKNPNVEVIGAFDPDISAFERANKELGTNLKFFNSYQDMLLAADAVVICSPREVRLSQLSIAVDEYGIDALSEPIEVDPVDPMEKVELENLLDNPHRVVMICQGNDVATATSDFITAVLKKAVAKINQ